MDRSTDPLPNGSSWDNRVIGDNCPTLASLSVWGLSTAGFRGGGVAVADSPALLRKPRQAGSGSSFLISFPVLHYDHRSVYTLRSSHWLGKRLAVHTVINQLEQTPQTSHPSCWIHTLQMDCWAFIDHFLSNKKEGHQRLDHWVWLQYTNTANSKHS